MRIQEFSPSGGGGGDGVAGLGPPDSKKLGQRFFVIFCCFLVLTLGSDGLFFGKQ